MLVTEVQAGYPEVSDPLGAEPDYLHCAGPARPHAEPTLSAGDADRPADPTAFDLLAAAGADRPVSGHKA